MKINIAFFKKIFLNKKFLSFLVIKKILVLYLIGSLLSQSAAVHAQAAPVANFVINRTIAGVLTKTAFKRGFAANDPIFVKTLTAVSNSTTALNVASTFAGVALTVAGAPVWLTIAAGLGVLGIGAYLSAGTSGKLELLQDNLKYSPTPTPVPPYVPAYPSLNDQEADEIASSIDNYFEVYQANGAKMYQGLKCFSTQPCFGLPVLPATYDPFIKQTIVSMTAGFSGDNFIKGSGEIVIVFDTIEEFARLFSLRPAVPFNNYYTQLTYADVQSTPLSSREYTYNADGSRSYRINRQIFDNFTWTTLPFIDVAADGSTRIIGVYTAFRECQSYGGETDTCAMAGTRWAPFSATYLSTDQYYTADNGFPLASTITARSDYSPALYPSADDLNTKLSTAQKGQKLSNVTIAALADAAWRKAAEQPGYDGIPYSVSAPVATSDVADYIAANPVPNVGDLLTLASDAGTQNVPITGSAQPGTGGSTPPPAVIAGDVNVVNTPNVNIVGKVKLDLGEGTGQSMPLVDLLPDFNLVFDPILSWASGQASRQMPPHVSECPAPIIDFFGNQIVLNAHCKLIEDNSATIGGVMLFVYSFTAFTVLFSA